MVWATIRRVWVSFHERVLRVMGGKHFATTPEDPEITAELQARQQRCAALGAAVTELTRVCAEHWPATLEADGETLARQLIAQVERARLGVESAGPGIVPGTIGARFQCVRIG